MTGLTALKIGMKFEKFSTVKPDGFDGRIEYEITRMWKRYTGTPERLTTMVEARYFNTVDNVALTGFIEIDEQGLCLFLKEFQTF